MGNKGRARASALFTKETFSGEAHRSLVELRDRGRLVAHMPGMIGPALSSWARPAQGSAAPPKVGRNEPCPCGSGNKYKHCHGATGVWSTAPEDARPGRAARKANWNAPSLPEAVSFESRGHNWFFQCGGRQ